MQANGRTGYVYGFVYGIRNITTGAIVYIGSTTQEMDQRYCRHLQMAFRRGSMAPLHQMMRKEGINSFQYFIIQEAYSHNEMFKLESQFIELYRETLVNKRLPKMSKLVDIYRDEPRKERVRFLKPLSQERKDAISKSKEGIVSIKVTVKELNETFPNIAALARKLGVGYNHLYNILAGTFTNDTNYTFITE